MIDTPLFTGLTVHLAAIDPEKDAAVESAWTYDLDYTQWMTDKPVRPLGAAAVKKIQEEKQKKSEESGCQYYWAVRCAQSEELVGFVRIPLIFWSHANAVVHLAFGSADHLARYGREALSLVLRYGFTELNLYRIGTSIPDYRTDVQALFEQAGFLMEVRRRKVFFRNGAYADALHYGLLNHEWQAQRQHAEVL